MPFQDSLENKIENACVHKGRTPADRSVSAASARLAHLCPHPRGLCVQEYLPPRGPGSELAMQNPQLLSPCSVFKDSGTADSGAPTNSSLPSLFHTLNRHKTVLQSQFADEPAHRHL